MKLYTCDATGCTETARAIVTPWFLLTVGQDMGPSEDRTFCSLEHLRSWLDEYGRTGELYQDEA